MELYIKLFEVLFPVFFIVGIGYFLGKKNPNFDTSFITTYSANFGTPSIVIFSISASGVTFAMFSEYFLYAVILLSSFLIVGLIFLILMKKDYLRELPTFFLPNTGNMGIPICLFAYGKLGMGIAAAISSLVVLLHFTLNIFLAKREFDLKVIIKSPSFYAIIANNYFSLLRNTFANICFKYCYASCLWNDSNDFNVFRSIVDTNESFFL